jgi:hypothetical protein
MFQRNTVWLSLGMVLLAGAAPGAAGAAEVPGKNSAVATELGGDGGAVEPVRDAAWRIAQYARPEASAYGGTGEGGERGRAGEGGKAADPARSTAAYLTQLGLIRGHLDVGTELYRIGDREAAVTHMKHPEDELYAALRPAFAKRGAPGFEKELAVLAATVEKNAGPDKVEAAYNRLVAALAQAESAVKPAPHEIGEVIHALVRAAANEYEEAVSDGRIVEPHEYQDALGFVRVAETWLKKLETAGADQSVVGDIRKQIALIRPAWTGVVPPQTVSVDPSQIHEAAARIEIATLALKPR